MGGKQLLDDATKQAIIKAYQAGKKIRDIEEDLHVSRSTIYWVLERAAIAPTRIKRKSRLSGDTHDLVQLYTVVEAQEARIELLEDFIRASGLEVPE